MSQAVTDSGRRANTAPTVQMGLQHRTSEHREYQRRDVSQLLGLLMDTRATSISVGSQEGTQNTRRAVSLQLRCSCFSQCCQMLLCEHLGQHFTVVPKYQQSQRARVLLTIISFLLLRNRSSTHHGHFLSHPLQFHHLTAPYQSYTQRVAPTALKYPGVCPTLDIFQPC